MLFRNLSIIVGALLAISVNVAQAATIDDVKAKGVVQCGVNTGLAGFSESDGDGNWTGFDVDYCRAMAAAIFNDPDAVVFKPLEASDRFLALRSGEIDILARNSAWTMTRDTSLGFAFTGVSYYGGQGFMTRKSLGIASALELSGAKICVRSGTTTELNLTNYFTSNNMDYELIVFNSQPEVRAAYDSDGCDAYSMSASALYTTRLTLTNPDDHVVLPEIISKEPLGPAVRQGDVQWFNIVKWVHFALLNAEELGITQDNVEEMKESENEDVRRLLGVDGSFGEGIGLGNDWAANVIEALGNYGEIFQRNVGAESELGIARGLNALWNDGGIQYAPPIK
jgi:general L-amino acid transport system substrate-binding protein